MADTGDQNQVGPPLVAAVLPDPNVAPAASAPTVTPEHLALVTNLVDTFAELTSVVREVDDRSRILERDRREAREEHEEAPELTQIWVHAIEPLAQYLTQPVQLAAGAKPVQLQEAAEQFGAWVATFRENAVGPGGQGLQQDPARLAAFETKLAAVDPTPAWLEQEGQRLLIRPELDPATVRRTVAATATSLTEEQERTKAIKEVLQHFDQEWEASIPSLEDQLRERRAELQLLADAATSSPELRRQATTGLAALRASTTNDMVAARVRFGEWIEKYQHEPTFTAEQVRQRINRELRPLMRTFQNKVDQASSQWTAKRLRDREQAAVAQRAQSQQQTLDDTIARVRERYARLVSVRRTKLGQEPDERFFGEMARLVNSAITDLGSLEADLLALRDRVATGSADQGDMAPIIARANHILRQSDDYADANHLERRLASHEKAKQREAERAAARERQLTRERAKEEQRQRAEAERQARLAEKKEKATKHYQATQKLQAERQAFERELRQYVTELTEANQERQRHAETIAALVATERQSLGDARRQLADQRAERRSMSAAEATNWLAQLATQERQLEERQARLDELTSELHALQAAMRDDQRLTTLRTHLGAVATSPVAQANAPATPVTDDAPIRIAIGRSK